MKLLPNTSEEFIIFIKHIEVLLNLILILVSVDNNLKMMKNCFLALLLCSCASSREINLVGKYSKMFHTIELKSDSTFLYKYRVAIPESEAFGKWETDDANQIILNSSYNINNFPVSVRAGVADIPHHKFIVLVGDNFEKDHLHNLEYELVVNGTRSIRVENPIIEYLHDTTIEYFRVNIYYLFKDFPYMYEGVKQVSSSNYFVDSKKANYFEVLMPITLNVFGLETIKNDTILIKKNKLYWKNKGESKFKRVK